VEPHHFYATPAPVKNFGAARARAPAPTLLNSKARKELKFRHMLKLSFSFDSVRFMLQKI
jgi:hypothetical protein